MQSKKTPEKKQPPVDVRIRFRADEIEAIRAAAAQRGLGFNTFVRLVSAGTAKLVLQAKAPPEELVGRFLDPDSVLMRGRQPSQSESALLD